MLNSKLNITYSAKDLICLLALTVVSMLLVNIAGEWQRLILIKYNAQYPWIIFTIPALQQALLFLASLIGWTGFLLGAPHQVQLGRKRPSSIIISHKILILSPLLLLQFYSFLALSCTWSLPWWALLFSSKNKQTTPYKILLASLALLTALTSGVLAPIILIFISLIFLNSLKKNLNYISLIAVPAIVCYLMTPELIWPDYHDTNRIVPEDGVPGLIFPLIGSYAPIPFLNAAKFQEIFLPIIFLLSIAFAALILLIKKINKKNLLIVGYLLAFNLLALADVFFQAPISQILPLKSLVRVIPHWFDLPISEILIYLLLAALCYYLIKLHHKINLKISSILIALQLLLVGYFYKLQSNFIEHTFTAISDNAWALSEANPLIAENGMDRILAAYHYQDLKLTSVKGLVAAIDFSAPTAARNHARVFDGNRRTRWYSKSNGQKGSEWVKIKFKNKLNVAIIELSPGVFKTDFPRGLELIDCSNSKETVLFKQSDWQGAIRFTPESFPYYSNQDIVQIVLANPKQFDCLYVKQIAVERYFDWSIAEIRLGLVDNT